MRTRIDRRTLLRRGTAGMLAGVTLAPRVHCFAESSRDRGGYVVGEPTAEKVGAQVLAEGGNAMDAVVAAALVAAVAAPHQTGVGGYGMHAVVAIEGGKRIVAIDGNSVAPAAMRADTFQLDDQGTVPGNVNEFGWLAAGVPGILAGLQLTIDRCGTRSFRELVQPAIRLARQGIRWPAGLTTTLRTGAEHFVADAGSRKLYFPDNEPVAAGSLFKNPELADMLESLASANTVEPFYRGEIGRQIANAFQKNGGLVAAQDLAAYQARLVEPLSVRWGDQTIYTAPLAAGGLTVLQTLLMLQAMNWGERPAGLPRTQARIEATRLAWGDRLALLGDPAFSTVPQAQLLSVEYARECSERIDAAVKAGKFLDHRVTPRDHGGTINLCAADQSGNFAALTLTHGNGFGARVTVEGLGLTLGHGMSRFDPHPDHPNAPGPGKRPLHNMVPTIVTRGGQPVLAVGGRGGRKIPNAMLDLLTQFVVLRQPLTAAIAAPRFHTEGNRTVEFEKTWPADETSELSKFGYDIKTGNSATLRAVANEDGALRPALR